jgi:hypothetical protein
MLDTIPLVPDTTSLELEVLERWERDQGSAGRVVGAAVPHQFQSLLRQGGIAKAVN